MDTRRRIGRRACGEEKIGNSKVNRGNSKTDESWDTRGILNSMAINYIKIQQVLACESTGYIVGLSSGRRDSCGFFHTRLSTFARDFDFLDFLRDRSFLNLIDRSSSKIRMRTKRTSIYELEIRESFVGSATKRKG